MNLTILPLSAILFDSDRFRTDLGDIDGLAASISDKGLLQPLVVDQNNTLVAGFRRFTAVRSLGWTEVPCVRRDSLSDAERRELELIENLWRKDFDWKETVRAVCTIHSTRLREAHRAGTTWSLEQTGAVCGGYAKSFVSYCHKLVDRLDDPAFARCESVTEAARLLYQEKADDCLREQAKRTLGQKPVALVDNVAEVVLPAGESPAPVPFSKRTIPLSHILHHGDCRDLLSTMHGCCDHIITDPPYAIDMTQLEQTNLTTGDVSRIEDTHQVNENLMLLTDIWPLFYNALRDTGFCVVWCDMQHWSFLATNASVAGFAVQRWPFTWCKTTPCKNGAPHYNFTKNTEIALVCRKKNTTLPAPVTSSYITCANDAERASNPFAKPTVLWLRLIESVSTPGQTILDPFAGEGSCPLAALAADRTILAIEKDEKHYNHLVTSVRDHYAAKYGKVEFV